ncbi:hypothetical protein ABBQ32_003197 [Trebouxia sp. C0010 RCD-2024]
MLGSRSSWRSSRLATVMRIKRCMAVALVCLCCFLWVVYAQPSSRPGTGSAQLLTQGRFGGAVDEMTGLAGLPLLFSWPASSLHTSFTGTTISATLSALPATAFYDVSSRFRFYVDEQQTSAESTDIGNTVIRWKATGLGPGRHNLTITKLSEASYGQVSLNTLTLGAGGRFLTPTLPPALASGRRIMVIGDSFTVGLANVGNASTCIPSTADCSEGNFNCHQLPVETEDASLSWGPLTAANFTADYQVIAWSGAALARESGDHSNLPQEVAQELTPSDIELFGRQVAGNRSRRVGNFSAWVPQVCSFLVMYFVHFLAFCSGGLFCILASLPM